MALNMQHLQSERTKIESQKDNQSSSIEQIKLNLGDNYIRILPPYDQKGYIFAEHWIHFLKDEENNWKVFKCSRSSEGRCPICERSKVLQESPIESEQALGKSIRGQHRYVYNALDKNYKGGILTVGPLCHGEIVVELHECGINNIDPTDYNNGCFIKVIKTGGQWNNTKYKARAERQLTSLPVEVVQNIKLHNLEELYTSYTYDELCQVLEGNFDPRSLFKNKQSQVQQNVQPTANQHQPQVVGGYTPQNTAPVQQPAVNYQSQPISQPINHNPIPPTPLNSGYIPPTQPTSQPNVAPKSVEEAKRLLGMI